jgi:hypothetical protein
MTTPIIPEAERKSPKHPLSKEARDIILQRYNQGDTVVSIAAAFGVARHTIFYTLRRHGVERQRHRKPPIFPLSDEIENDIIARYGSGANAMEVGSSIGVSGRTVFNVLIRRGIKPRSVSETHKRIIFREDAFSTITPDSAYWAGFILADGYINPKKNSIRVNLVETDASHVESLRDFMGGTQTIGYIKATEGRPGWVSKPQRCVAFTSPRAVSDLAALGVVSTKSRGVDVAPLLYNADFWRGVIDGDGSVGRGNRPHISVVGSHSLLEQYLVFVRSVFPECLATVRPHKTIFSVHLLDRAALAVLQALYNHGGTGLPRKIARAANIIERFKDKKWRILSPKGCNKYPRANTHRYREKMGMPPLNTGRQRKLFD